MTAATAPRSAVKPAKLTVDGVSRSFRSMADRKRARFVQVLKNISFEMNEGEIVSVVGLSGCGKTTLLRIIGGLLEPDSGAIRVDGRDVSGPGHDRAIVFQQASLLPWRTTLRNVQFGLELKRTDKDVSLERSRAALELVGLKDYERYYPKQLSGGMQQRVGLARALAVDPQILLMDEPFSALDAQTREGLQAELLQLQATTRKTIMFVTHDLDEAVYLSNRILVLLPHPGRVHKIIDVNLGTRGSVDEVKSDPAFLTARDIVAHEIRAGGDQ
ncbi:ABC transporter ATP-binding protein [Nocardia miyunensis]|uniref:ABC transporter ATP-binding protein n=1 Tax=Nocardia miyunensis TaxID=282684 RepID=UPI0008379DC4|nr:ABC transporter ATP-binding protein [Nocardia miyunensis]